jgi:hypothetical protein
MCGATVQVLGGVKGCNIYGIIRINGPYGYYGVFTPTNAI